MEIKNEKQEIEYNYGVSKKWKTTSIILIILTLLFSLYLGTSYIYNKGLSLGYTQCQIDLIQNIQSTGDIPYFVQEENNTVIKTINIQEICKNG